MGDKEKFEKELAKVMSKYKKDMEKVAKKYGIEIELKLFVETLKLEEKEK